MNKSAFACGDVYKSMTHRFLSEAFYIVMMNEVNKERNTNSYTSYNLELFMIFIKAQWML